MPHSTSKGKGWPCSISRLLLWHLFAPAESHFRLGRAAKAGRSAN